MSMQQNNFTKIADAIRTKTGGNNPIIALDFSDEILSISTISTVEEKDVNFIDYDGTRLFSYTISEAQALTSLPTPPAHNGLIFQSWNWSLSDVTSTSMPITVGALYTTESGKTEFDLAVTNATGLSITLYVTNSASGTMTVDWGDGSQDSQAGTGALTFTHTYSAIGNYTALVDSSVNYTLTGTSATPYNIFRTSISEVCTNVRVGTRCTGIGAYAFYNCIRIVSAAIANTVTNIATYAFYSCVSLLSASIPSTLTSVGSYSFQYCFKISSISIPNSMTSIANNAFQGCCSLSFVSIPITVASINNSAFQNSYLVIKYAVLRTTPPALASTSAFSGINPLCIILVPKGSLSAYQSATNWSTYASQMREVD